MREAYSELICQSCGAISGLVPPMMLGCQSPRRSIPKDCIYTYWGGKTLRCAMHVLQLQ